MYVFISILILIASILLILIVLIQNSKGGGLASGIRTSSGTSQRAGGENRYIVLFALRKIDPLGAEEETAAKRRGGMSGR